MESWKLFIALLFCAAVLFACAEQPPTDAPEAPTEETPADAPEESAETNPLDEPDAAPADDVSAQLMAYLGNRGSLEWKIAYDLSTVAQGQTFNGEMIQYLKGEDKIRTDMTTQGIETRTFFVNDVLTSCNKMSGEWSCLRIESDPQDDEVDTDEIEQNFEENPDDYSVVPDGVMQVAGYTATCFKLIANEDDATVRYCFSSDSLPLYIKADYPGVVTEMTATSVSKSVANSEFEPPVEPTDAPSQEEMQNDPCAGCAFLSGAQKDQCLQYCGG